MSDGFYKAQVDNWPRLTESLKGPRDPMHCQSCGMVGNTEECETEGRPTLYRWREHNQFDKPENRVVILCVDCEKKLIDKHPRLYARIDRYAPEPGTMNICIDCSVRDGLDCKSPLAQRNGGEGMVILIPRPSDVHVCRSPRSHSGWMKIYPGPARGCQGKPVEAATEGAAS